MILPRCLALAPAAEALTLACEIGRCSVCARPACAEHDRCHGCGRVICESCDTRGGMVATRFPGDSQPHPHNGR